MSMCTHASSTANHKSSGQPAATSSKRARKAPTRNAKSWEPYKERVLQLHIGEGRSLKEVREIMRNTGLDATERQYRTRITQWKKDKNIKFKEMQAIVRKRQYRALLEQEKPPLRFEVRSIFVSDDQIDRWMKRSNVAEDEIFSPGPMITTPSAVECETVANSPASAPSPRSDVLDGLCLPAAPNNHRPQGQTLLESEEPLDDVPSYDISSTNLSVEESFRDSPVTYFNMADTTVPYNCFSEQTLSPKPSDLQTSRGLYDYVLKVSKLDPVGNFNGGLSSLNMCTPSDEMEFMEKMIEGEVTNSQVSEDSLRVKLFLSELLIRHARFSVAETLLEECSTLTQLNDDLRKKALGRILELLGMIYLFRQRSEQAVGMFKDVLCMVSSGVIELSLRRRLTIELCLSRAYRQIGGRRPDTEKLLTQVLSIEAGKDCDQVQISAAIDLSMIYRTTGRLVAAEHCARLAVSMARKAAITSIVVACQTQVELSRVLQDRGRAQEALQLLRKLDEDLKRACGEEHQITRWVRRHLALAYISQGHWTDAEHLLTLILKQNHNLFGQHHLETRKTVRNLIFVYVHLYKTDRSASLVEILTRNSEIPHGQLYTRAMLAVCALDVTVQYRSKAVPQRMFTMVIEALRRVPIDDHGTIFVILEHLLGIYEEQGRWGALYQVEHIRANKLHGIKARQAVTDTDAIPLIDGLQT